MQTKLRSGIFR